jgi:hypothetical protein
MQDFKQRYTMHVSFVLIIWVFNILFIWKKWCTQPFGNFWLQIIHFTPLWRGLSMDLMLSPPPTWCTSQKRLDLWNASMKNPLEGMKWLSCFYGLEYWVHNLSIHHLLDFFQCFPSKHPHVMACISRMPSIGKISSQVSSPMISSTWYNTHFLWRLEAWVLVMFVKAFLGFLNWCGGCVPRQ